MSKSLASGRAHLAIPGPSVMPDRVLRAMHCAAPNIYEGDLLDLTATIYEDLNVLAGNSGDAIIYIGNGHAAWEASLVNTLSRGDRILALVTGRFGQGWVSMAEALGIDVQILDFGMSQSASPDDVASALQADTDHQIKAVITVQTDTATSITNDIASIRRAMNRADHPALLMVDCIASFACEPFHMNEWGVDVMMTASQKGLMTPPGLAVMFIRETVWPYYEKADLKTPYWDWLPRVKPSYFAAHFCGTPPTHHLYGLREALDILLEEGMENVWYRHQVQASAVWAAVEAWGVEGDLQLNVPLKSDRSLAVTSVKTREGLAPRLREWCEQEAGLTLGIGFNLVNSGEPTTSVFRIGHMGHLNPHSLLGTLGSIEAGLSALDIKGAGRGVEAAIQVMASNKV
ncbi:MAG: alanine--glyoxylate aminotransferase family protein [Granulosicoccus sp.]